MKTRRIMGGYGWVIATLACFLDMGNAGAMPAFARQYNLSCSACHVAYPRLSKFGEQFRDMNYRLPNWRDQTIDLGDAELALPKLPPIALRAQAYVQGRDGEEIDPVRVRPATVPISIFRRPTSSNFSPARHYRNISLITSTEFLLKRV